MGFFSALFGKKKPSLKTHRVYMTRAAANHALAKQVEELTVTHKKVIVVYCFRETRNEIERLLLGTHVTWVNALQVGFIPGANDPQAVVIFAESYPEDTYEKKLLGMLEQSGFTQKVLFFDAIEDPIYVLFGAERIRKLMNMLGIKEDEAIEHRSITLSMEKMQRKFTDKKLLTHKTDSRVELLATLNGMKEQKS